MKLKLCALAFSTMAIGAAHAEDKLFEVYGILDVAYGYQSNGLKPSKYIGSSINSATFFSSQNPNVGAHSGLWSGALSQDRIGAKGSKTFDNGVRIGYLLETGFNIVGGNLVDANHQMADNRGTNNYKYSASNSSQNGQILNREAYAKFGYGNFGDLQIGRNQTLIADALSGTAALQNSGVFSYSGASGAFGGGSGISETQRLDRSVKYVNNFGAYNLGLMYADGDGNALTKQGKMWGAGVGYKANGLTLRLAYTDQKNAIKQSINTSNTTYEVKGTVYDTKGLLLGAGYEINSQWGVNAGFSQFVMSKASDQNIPTGAYGSSLTASVYVGEDQKAYMTWIGANYKATDALKLYAAYQRAHYDGYCAAATCTASSSNLKTAANVDWVGVIVDYDLRKDLDLYGAFADIRVSNTATTAYNAITTTPISHNKLLAAGLRYKF